MGIYIYIDKSVVRLYYLYNRDPILAMTVFIVGQGTVRACCGLIWVNTLRPTQNGRHFPDDIFKCIFLNENVRLPIKISLKFVPKGPINKIPAFVQIMAWRRQATSHYLNQLWLVYWRIYASLGLNELISPMSSIVTSLVPGQSYHIEAETKWPPFRRRHFQIHFSWMKML